MPANEVCRWAADPFRAFCPLILEDINVESPNLLLIKTQSQEHTQERQVAHLRCYFFSPKSDSAVCNPPLKTGSDPLPQNCTAWSKAEGRGFSKWVPPPLCPHQCRVTGDFPLLCLFSLFALLLFNFPTSLVHLSCLHSFGRSSALSLPPFLVAQGTPKPSPGSCTCLPPLPDLCT